MSRFLPILLTFLFLALSGCLPRRSDAPAFPQAAARIAATVTDVPAEPPPPIPTDTITRTVRPTLPPRPTRTPLPTATQTATLTAEQALEAAAYASTAGDYFAAVAQYTGLLTQTTDPTINRAILAALAEIAPGLFEQANAQAAQSPNRENNLKACELSRLAQSAFNPVLSAPDRPTFAQNRQLYLNSVASDLALIACAKDYHDPALSQLPVIATLLERLDLYPADPAIVDLMAPEIYKFYDLNEFIYLDSNPELVNTDGQLIKTKIGDYPLDGLKISTLVDFLYLRESLCWERRPLDPDLAALLATSPKKKVLPCDSTYKKGILDQAGLLAEDASQVWYVLDADYVDLTSYTCTLTLNKKIYPYTYPKSQTTYFIGRVPGGEHVSEKVFQTAPPRCDAYQTCTLDTRTDTVHCTGGEAKPTAGPIDPLVEWLQTVKPTLK